MSWKIRFFLLVSVSIPAFTGYPVNTFNDQIIPGVTWGWVWYWLAAGSAILCILGSTHFSNAIAVSALITLPVVFVGGGVSYLMHLFGFGHPGDQVIYSAHYVSLCLTMLTVIPLALSLVAVIPFHEIEQNLLSSRRGISMPEKSLLMFLRVFNHVIYFVIPNIMEVMYEEGRLPMSRGDRDNHHRKPIDAAESGSSRVKFWVLIRVMIRIGTEGICAAMQYIPLWAVEISRLPGRKSR